MPYFCSKTSQERLKYVSFLFNNVWIKYAFLIAIDLNGVFLLENRDAWSKKGQIKFFPQNWVKDSFQRRFFPNNDQNPDFWAKIDVFWIKIWKIFLNGTLEYYEIILIMFHRFPFFLVDWIIFEIFWEIDHKWRHLMKNLWFWKL